MNVGMRALCIAATASLIPLATAAPIVLSGAGADAAAIQATVDAFRAALGDPDNGSAPGSQGAGRREVTWDEGGDAAPQEFFSGVPPMTTFVDRGSVFITLGPDAFVISGQPDPEFGGINPSYPAIFQTFSSPRLFGILGFPAMFVVFTVPGTTPTQYPVNPPVVSSGFGAVFTDVDLANTTSLEYFDASGSSLGTYFVPTQNEGLSFLGVKFDDAIVASVIIRAGNASLFSEDGGDLDVVAMDNFIFGEPRAFVVHEPATLVLLSVALLALLWRREKRSES